MCVYALTAEWMMKWRETGGSCSGPREREPGAGQEWWIADKPEQADRHRRYSGEGIGQTR